MKLIPPDSAQRAMLVGFLIVLLITGALVVWLVLPVGNGNSNQGQKSEPKLITVTVSLPSTVTSTNIISRTEYISAVLTLPPNFVTSETTHSEVATYLPNCITAASTLLAVALGFGFTYATGRSSRRYEWGKFLWDKYQEPYLELYSTVKQSSDPEFITRKIATLGGKYALPPRLDQQLKTLLVDLRQPLSEAEKQEKRDTFLKSYAAFIQQPWDYL